MDFGMSEIKYIPDSALFTNYEDQGPCDDLTAMCVNNKGSLLLATLQKAMFLGFLWMDLRFEIYRAQKHE